MPDIPLAFALAWLTIGAVAVTAVLLRRRRRRTSHHPVGTAERHHEHRRIH